MKAGKMPFGKSELPGSAPGWVEFARWRECKDLYACFCDTNRMLELRRQGFVAGHRGPLIGKNLGLGAPEIHHRLDREKHARLQPRARARTAIVQDVGWRVKHAPQAMAAKISDNRHALRFDERLYRMTDIAKRVAGFDCFYPLEKRIVRHLNQTLGFARELAGDVHARGVAVPSIDDHGDIDIENITVLQPLFPGNAVAHHVVHTDATGVLIPLVPDGGRCRARLIHHAGDSSVDGPGRRARKNQRCNLIQNMRGKSPRPLHTGEVALLINPDTILGQAALRRLIHDTFLSHAPAYRGSLPKVPEVDCSARFQNRQCARDRDLISGNFSAKAKHFDTGGPCCIECGAVSGVQITRQQEPVAVRTLNKVKHHRAVTLRDHRGQISQVFRAAFSHAIRKLGKAGLAHQVNVFHLDISVGQALFAEQKVDPAVGAVPYLRPHLSIGSQRLDCALLQRLFHHAVRHGSVDPGHMSAGQVDQTPTELELLLRIVVRLEPYPRARLGQTHHRAGVRAMGHDLAPVRLKRDIGKEPFVAPDQARWNQRRLKAHGSGPIPAEYGAQGRVMANPTAAMLVIGDEILSGRTRDANMHHLAGRLTEVGIDLKEVRVVSDDAPAIIAAVRALASEFDHVFTSGGIGPTHDDITADSIAEALGRSIDVRDDARTLLQAHYDRQGIEMNAARLRMARIPEDATLIENPISAAPGFTLENVHVMAGVPSIFQAMVETVLPTLTGGEPLLSETVTISRGEGDIAGPLSELAKAFPTLGFGSYPYLRDGRYGANIVIRGSARNELARAKTRLMSLFEGDAS